MLLRRSLPRALFPLNNYFVFIGCFTDIACMVPLPMESAAAVCPRMSLCTACVESILATTWIGYMPICLCRLVPFMYLRSLWSFSQSFSLAHSSRAWEAKFHTATRVSGLILFCDVGRHSSSQLSEIAAVDFHSMEENWDCPLTDPFMVGLVPTLSCCTSALVRSLVRAWLILTWPWCVKSSIIPIY